MYDDEMARSTGKTVRSIRNLERDPDRVLAFFPEAGWEDRRQKAEEAAKKRDDINSDKWQPASRTRSPVFRYQRLNERKQD